MEADKLFSQATSTLKKGQKQDWEPFNIHETEDTYFYGPGDG